MADAEKAPAAAPAPAPPASAKPSPPSPTRRREDEKGRVAAARAAIRSASRTENIVAAFLFMVLLGCAGIWLEHDRCPGALASAAFSVAPLAIALAVPVGALLAMVDRVASVRVRTARGILFSLWAAAASLSMTTAVAMAINERGEVQRLERDCVIARRETVAARTAGISDWILVISCSDRMSRVRVDVTRQKWWENEPGKTVPAVLLRGRLGYEWVVDVPSLGAPTRRLP